MLRTSELLLETSRLGPRQRAMLEVICAIGGATVREIHALIPDPPNSICGLRTQLNRLVKKGLVRRRRSGRHSEILYLPAQSWAEVQTQALERLANEYFQGSTRQAILELMRLAANERFQGLHAGSRRAA